MSPKARPLYAYRLLVEYPDITEPPKCWEEMYMDEPNAVFQWPRVKTYLSLTGVRKRADMLRRYGCVVTIERSEPITWTKP